MWVTKAQVYEDLLDPQIMMMHGYSSREIKAMSETCLVLLYNELFEPIDEGDPFYVVNVVPTYQAMGVKQ